MVKKNNFTEITTILGLGNPGPKFEFTPHNIGFLVLDQLNDQFHGEWQAKKNMLISNIVINDKKFLLIKPQTFMNLSGEIFSHLNKQGIKLENIIVIHDEIDFPFGKINFKDGGSARGHNGLRSIIQHAGDQFLRLRIGVGRPKNPDVGHFVTAPFQETDQEVSNLIQNAIDQLNPILYSE